MGINRVHQIEDLSFVHGHTQVLHHATAIEFLAELRHGRLNRFLILSTIKGGKDWTNFSLTLAVYFIGGLAVTIALYVIIWATIIAIAGYVALLLASKSLSKPVDKSQLQTDEEATPVLEDESIAQ